MLSPPVFIEDREEPYRVEIAIWIELPTYLVVGKEILTPEDRAGALGRLLEAAIEEPLAGSARKPDLIRVANASLAAEVRGAVGEAIPVRVAATPELDALLDAMFEGMLGDDSGDEEESYFERGRIAPATVAELFTAADLLFRAAPWKTATADLVVRLDIPALDVEGACVSLIGHLGQHRGFVVFPSIAGYEAFLAAAETLPGPGPVDLGAGWLALAFERKRNLPAPMRNEVAAHGWPVAGSNAYPRVERRDPDGVMRPLVERDVRIVAACAAVLSAFYFKHRHVFEQHSPEPVCESYFDDDHLEVRFTFPYEAFDLFDAGAGRGPAALPPPPTVGRAAKVGRNDPCPCGSGRKYKKCHLPLDEKARAVAAGTESSHQLDLRLCTELGRFAAKRFGYAWLRFADDFDDLFTADQLAGPWSVFHFRVNGRTVVEWYLDQDRRRLSERELSWLVDQRAAWLSVWEVSAVEPGVSLTLRDLLSGETRSVTEASASQTLLARDAILGRVVDHEGASLLCGVHPHPLPPFEAAAVVERVRGKLRRRREVPLERLREDTIGRYLIRRWEEELAALDARNAVPRQLQNTDPLSTKIDRRPRDPHPEPPPEAVQLELEFKQRHYADWADDPLPALDGETPREAVRTRPGRARVDVLLKTMENHEQRRARAGSVAFDFSAIRKQLRLR